MASINRFFSSFLIAITALGTTAFSVHAQQAKTPTGQMPTMKHSGTLSDNDEQRYRMFYMEAMAQMVKENYAAAYDLLNHCLTIKPDAAELYFFLVPYLSELKEDSLIIKNTAKAARLQPDNAYYTEQLGLNYLSTNKWKEAAEVYEKLWSMNKTREDVLDILIHLYEQLDNPERQFDALQRKETLEGPTMETTLGKMFILNKQGKKKEELKELDKLAAHFPYDLNYKVMKGNWLMQHNQSKKALDIYKDVIRIEPDNVMARVALVDYYKQQGETDKADAMIVEMILSPKTGNDERYDLLNKYIEEEDSARTSPRQTLDLLDKAIQIPPRSEKIAELKAAYMLYNGMDSVDITEAFATVLDINPENSMARLQCIKGAADAEDYERLFKLAKDGTIYDPDAIVFHYFLAGEYYRRGLKDEAFTTFTQAQQLINDATDTQLASDIYANIGYLLYDKKQKKESFDAFDKSLKFNEDNIECLNNYAYYLTLENENLDKAEVMGRKIVEAEPDNANFLDTYAWILFRLKRYEEAKTYIDKALDAETEKSATILEHAGDIHSLLGETDRALTYWKEAYDKNGNNETLARKIKEKRFVEPKTKP